MKFNIDKQERYTIFKLEDEKLNSLSAPVLKSEMVLLANQGVTNLVMDLSNVEFVDSSGLSAILTADRLWKSLGTFILIGIDHLSVKKLIKISRLDSVLTILPTASEAIDYVFMEELSREINGEEEE